MVLNSNLPNTDYPRSLSTGRWWALGLASVVPSLGISSGGSPADRILSGYTFLNSTGRTFTRATSAYDPVHNTIVAPGVARQRNVTIGTTVEPPDLIEGPRTNILPAGSSEHLTLFGGSAGDVQTDQVIAGPSGEVIISKYAEGSGTNFHATSISAAVAAAALPYTLTLYMQALPGDLHAAKSVQIDDGGGTNGAVMSFNITTGAITSAAAALGAGWTAISGSVTAWKSGWRVVLTATNNSVTTMRVVLWNNSSRASYAGDSVSGYYAGMFSLEQAAFPSSYISNRNLHIQSNSFSNAAWTKTDTVITANSVANPLSGLVDVALFTEGSAGTAQVFNAASLTVTSSGTYTVTRYLKLGNSNVVLLQVSNGAITSGFRLWVNLSTGLAGTFAAFGTGTAVSQSVTALSGGWYKVTLTGTIGAFTGLVSLTQSASADNSTTRVSGATRYEANAQCEPGSTATAYWGVNATVGGRDGDVLTSTFSLSTTSGTLLALFIPYGWTGNTGTFNWLVDDNTTAGVASIRINAAGVTEGLGKDTIAVLTSTGPAGTPSNGVLQQSATVLGSANVKAYENGTAGTPTAATPPWVASTAHTIGNKQDGSQPAFGWVAVLYKSSAETAANLLTLSQAGTLG